MNNYYEATVESPYHLSVGAVLVRKDKTILCHYFKQFESRSFPVEILENFYTLMRETLNPGESFEEGIARGLKEEFGATGNIMRYLGSLKSQFYRRGVLVEKTTVYFLAELVEIDSAHREMDREVRQSVSQWQLPEFLIEKMKEQGIRYPGWGMDESTIVERAAFHFSVSGDMV